VVRQPPPEMIKVGVENIRRDELNETSVLNTALGEEAALRKKNRGHRSKKRLAVRKG